MEDCMAKKGLFLLLMLAVIFLHFGCTRTKMLSGKFFCSPVWQPGGNRFYFLRNDIQVKEIASWVSKEYETESNIWTLCSCNSNGGAIEEILKIFDSAQESPNLYRYEYAAISYSSITNKISYELTIGNQKGIFVINLNSLDTRQLASTGRNPSWDHDGSHIVFNEDNGGIWIMDSLGSNKTEISDFGWEPKWSPTGEWIVFADSWNPTGIWKIKPDGTGLIKLQDNGDNPVWNETGERIAFCLGARISICDTIGSIEVDFEEIGGRDLNWSFGEYILFQSGGILKFNVIDGVQSGMLLENEYL
jgi:Tol biopolymer transport system component